MDKTPPQLIEEADEGIRLDRWFKRHYPGLPHALLEKYLRKGDIRLNGKKAKAADRVQAGQEIHIRIQDPGFKIQEKNSYASLNPESRILSPADLQLIQNAVLYKDANIIVINKPYGLPVQGGSKISKSIDDLLVGLTFDAGEKPKLVHRLDRDTTGVLVLARSSKMAARLGKGFAGKSIEKTYWALVNGSPLQLKGTIDQPMLKKENPRAEGHAGGPDGRDYEIMRIDPEGQKAITEYRVLDTLARKFALMELKPLTGRTHQLRVHMQSIECPIVGDHKYGGGTEAAAAIGVENILHLHARRIVIPAAVTGSKTIDISAPLPPHMQKSFRALGLDVPKGK